MKSLLAQSETAQEARTLLQKLDEQIDWRFDSVESNALYAECTILDPRFKGKRFPQRNQLYKSINIVKDVSRSHANTCGT